MRNFLIYTNVRVVIGLNAELDTGYDDEFNAWRLLRAYEGDT